MEVGETCVYRDTWLTISPRRSLLREVVLGEAHRQPLSSFFPSSLLVGYPCILVEERLKTVEGSIIHLGFLCNVREGDVQKPREMAVERGLDLKYRQIFYDVQYVKLQSDTLTLVYRRLIENTLHVTYGKLARFVSWGQNLFISHVSIGERTVLRKPPRFPVSADSKYPRGSIWERKETY